MINKYIFLIILGLAIALRIYGLNIFPPSLNWDEISIGYNAYSVFKTGQDEWGNAFPLSFRAYGDYKLPGYIYLDIPFVAILGLNEWGVRLPSALLGVGTVVLIYFLLKYLTGSRTISFWGMFLASLLPWSIILSRIALEANLALFLTVAAIYSFLIGLSRKSYLILASFLFGLTIFSYNSSRVVTPLLILILGFIYKDKLRVDLKFSAISLTIFLVFFSIALPQAFLQDSSARYKWTTILDSGAISKIEQLRNTSSFPPFFTKIIYNRPLFFISEAGKHYISHFDPRFLMINGGSHYQFSIPGHGLIYITLLPFLVIGILKIFKEKINWQLFILFWLLIAPLPAAITRDSPHSLRSLLMIPPLLIIISLGIGDFLAFLKKPILNYILAAVFLFSLVIFWQKYTGDYIKDYSWSWQYGYKEATAFITEHGLKYDKIYITKKYGEPHEFLLFYLKYDPQKYISNLNLIRFEKSDWFWVDRFDNYLFLNDWEIKEKALCNIEEKCLLITSPGNYPENSQIIQTTSFLDGKAAFDIVELSNVQ